MLRRNFVASLAALFAARKLPKVEDDFELGEIYPSIPSAGFLSRNEFYYHNQFKQWVKIKAAEPIDVGGLVYIDAATGMAKECHLSKQHDHKIGVCMVNNWPEDVVVALYA